MKNKQLYLPHHIFIHMFTVNCLVTYIRAFLSFSLSNLRIKVELASFEWWVTWRRLQNVPKYPSTTPLIHAHKYLQGGEVVEHVGKRPSIF